MCGVSVSVCGCVGLCGGGVGVRLPYAHMYVVNGKAYNLIDFLPLTVQPFAMSAP